MKKTTKKEDDLENRPDVIKVHEKNPKLAKEIVKAYHENIELKREEQRLKNRIELNAAKRKVLWDEIELKYREDIRVIAPEHPLEWIVDGAHGNMVFVRKSQKKKCGDGKCPPPMFKEILKRIRNGESSGFIIGGGPDDEYI